MEEISFNDACNRLLQTVQNDTNAAGYKKLHEIFTSVVHTYSENVLLTFSDKQDIIEARVTGKISLQPRCLV